MQVRPPEAIGLAMIAEVGIKWGSMVVAALIIYMAILVSLSVYDFRSDCLPDKLTIGGAIWGILISAMCPQLHGQTHAVPSMALSFLGAISGFALGLIICNGGKRFFGTKTVKMPEGSFFGIYSEGNDQQLAIGENVQNFKEIFSRYTDRITFDAVNVLFETTVPVEPSEVKTITISHDTLWLDHFQIPLANVRKLTGTCNLIKLPQEIIGYGLVKMMALVGAFLGWKGALIVILNSFALCALVMLLFALSTRFTSLPRRVQISPYVTIVSAGYIFLLYRFQ